MLFFHRIVDSIILFRLMIAAAPSRGGCPGSGSSGAAPPHDLQVEIFIRFNVARIHTESDTGEEAGN